MWSSNVDNNASFDGGFDNTSHREEDGKAKQKAQTLFPVMVGHLLSVPSTEDVTVWGIPARMFTIVGIVRNVEETATKISYDIEDQTGTIVALKWLEADRKASDRTMQVNTYVRVTGLLREQNDKRHILILRMWPLQNLNELTYHLLEVTFVSLKAESMYGKLNVTNYSKSDDRNATSNGDSYIGNLEYGLAPGQKLVYELIRSRNETDTGIERSELKQKVPEAILPEVDNILDFLVSEGHIYTTCTDDHFKTT